MTFLWVQRKSTRFFFLFLFSHFLFDSFFVDRPFTLFDTRAEFDLAVKHYLGGMDNFLFPSTMMVLRLLQDNEANARVFSRMHRAKAKSVKFPTDEAMAVWIFRKCPSICSAYLTPHYQELRSF